MRLITLKDCFSNYYKFYSLSLKLIDLYCKIIMKDSLEVSEQAGLRIKSLLLWLRLHYAV